MAEIIRLSERQIFALAEAISRKLNYTTWDRYPGWFSVFGAAKYSDYSTASIESAIRLGLLKSKKVRITGNRFSRRIKREWLDAWIEDQPED